MNIALRVKNLIKRHETRDPFRIAKDLGIIIKYRPYTETKGYFLKVNTNKFIVINSNLSDLEKLLVCSHELGHAILHSNNKYALTYEKGLAMVQDFTLFPVNSIYENQANKFAAELLMDSEFFDSIFSKHTDLDPKIYEALMRLRHTRI